MSRIISKFIGVIMIATSALNAQSSHLINTQLNYVNLTVPGLGFHYIYKWNPKWGVSIGLDSEFLDYGFFHPNTDSWGAIGGNLDSYFENISVKNLGKELELKPTIWMAFSPSLGLFFQTEKFIKNKVSVSSNLKMYFPFINTTSPSELGFPAYLNGDPTPLEYVVTGYYRGFLYPAVSLSLNINYHFNDRTFLGVGVNAFEYNVEEFNQLQFIIIDPVLNFSLGVFVKI